MGLSISYQLSARGNFDKISGLMRCWHQAVQRLPMCHVSELHLRAGDTSFYVRCGAGAELARMRLREETAGVWSGSWDCKTQFAGRPEYGGLENFITTHCRLIEVLDLGRTLGLVESVCDDGCYWTGRQVGKLLQRFNAFQNAVASMVALASVAGLATVNSLSLTASFPQMPPNTIQPINEEPDYGRN